MTQPATHAVPVSRDRLEGFFCRAARSTMCWGCGSCHRQFDRHCNLLNRVQRAHALTLVVVSHDPDVIAHHCDRAAAMRNGRIEHLRQQSDLYSTL